MSPPVFAPPATVAPVQLGERFDAALIYASEVHRKQQRKGTEVPYASHLLGVTASVLEDGGDEDQSRPRKGRSCP